MLAVRLRITLLLACLTLASAAAADVLDNVLERQSLRVGVSLFAPWTMENDSGDLLGYEVDLANQLAQDLGVNTELKVYAWDKIIPALQGGEIDLIAAGMAISPQRALRVNFSTPYMSSGVTLAANTVKTSGINSLADMNAEQVTIVSVTDSLGDELAKRLFDQATLLSVSDKEAAEQAVLNGEAHAYVASVPETFMLTLTHPGVLDVPLGKPLLESKAGLAVKKGEQEWLNFLNAWIVAKQADGWLDTNYSYWFRSLDWQPRLTTQ